MGCVVNIDQTKTHEDPNWQKAILLNRRLSKPKTHAVRILGIQKEKDGWVKRTVLKHVGVMKSTLVSLRQDGLVESADASTYFRLSLFGRAWLEHLEDKETL